MRRLTIRHLAEADLPHLVALYQDGRFQAYVDDAARHTDPDEVAERHRQIIHSGRTDTMIFTLRSPGGEVVGFAWLREIDWVAQTGRLGGAMLADRRYGLGALGLRAMFHYACAELNLRVIVTRVREGNVMMRSADRVGAQAQVVSPYYHHSEGRYRRAYLWTESWEQVLAREAAANQQRWARGARIRRLAGGAGGADRADRADRTPAALPERSPA
jgi:RimJ/RimL family protein N-acetyltransferase